MAKYSIGISYGKSSGRAVLADVETGMILGSSDKKYVRKTKPGTIHPMELLEVLSETVPQVIKSAAVSPADIIGIGVSLGTGTLLPVMSDGTPLCFFREYADDPETYVKLGSYMTDSAVIEKMNDVAAERMEAFPARRGGKITSDWMLPKAAELALKAPAVYETCDYLIEAGDWVVWQLTGVQTRNAYAASAAAGWSSREGYPSAEYFAAVDPVLEKIVETKLVCKVLCSGSCAGTVSAFVAKSLGLSPETKVAVAESSINAGMAGAGACGPGRLFCSSESSVSVLSDSRQYVPGVSGPFAEESFPGCFIYRAVLSSDSTLAAWYENNFGPVSDPELLSSGPSGLIALDSCGMLFGMDKDTPAGKIFLALNEAKAFNLKTTVNEFENHEIPVTEIFAAGEFAADDNMLKLYANVLNLPVKAGDEASEALGSAIAAAVAAGAYPDMLSAAKTMGNDVGRTFLPDTACASVYAKLYREYLRLSDCFACGANDVMGRLSDIKAFTGTAEKTGSKVLTRESLAWASYTEDAEYDGVLPTLDSEFGDTEALTGLDNLPDDDGEYSEEVKTAAAAAAKELFEAIDAVAAIRGDAEIYAAFKDLIEEEADRHTNEIIAAADEVASSLGDAETEAYFDELIKEQAEKNTKEIIDAADEVVRLMEEAEHEAVFGDAIREEAEKNTKEILAAVDEVIKLLEEADNEAAENTPAEGADAGSDTLTEPASMATEVMNKLKNDEAANEINRFASIYNDPNGIG